jgi:hypothetical protein
MALAFRQKLSLEREQDRLFAQAVRELGEDDAIEICVLERCDFALAREQFAHFFRDANAEARSKGEKAVFKMEFVKGWDSFDASPSAAVAREWLKRAPDYKPLVVSLLFECCPGGTFHPR